MRFQNTPGILTPGGVYPNGTDSYYRLHRVSQMLFTNQTYPLHDTWLSYPIGFDVPWPMGLDWTLALLCKLFGVQQQKTMEAFLAVTIPFLSLPTLWVLGALATKLTTPLFGILSGVILVFLGGHVTPSAVGEIDHHFLEAFFTITSVFLLARLKSFPDSKATFFTLLSTLVLAPCFWPQAWVLSAFIFLALIFDQERASLLPIFAKLFLYAGVAFFMVLLLSDTAAILKFSIYGFSAWSSILYLAISCFFHAWVAMRNKKINPHAMASWSFFFFGWIFFTLAKPSAPLVSHIFHEITSVLHLSRGLFNITGEGKSMFSLDMHGILYMGALPLLFSLLWWMKSVLLLRHLWIVGFSFLPLLFSCAQLRLLYMATPLLALLSTLFMFETLRTANFSVFMKRTCAVLFVTFLCIPNIFQWKWTSFSNAHPMFQPVVRASRYLKTYSQLLEHEKSDMSVLATWDYGHWILYYASLPVIAHPFQSSSSLASTGIWISEGTDMLREFEKTHPTRFLMVEAPTGKLQRWLLLFDKNPETYVDLASMEAKPAFYDLLISRFYFGYGISPQGDSPAQWKFIYASPYASPDSDKLTALKLFEHVAGATLEIQHSPPGEKLYLQADIALPSLKEVVKFRQSATTNAQGHATFRVPYFAENSPHVSFDGSYRMTNHAGHQILRTPAITENQIRAGDKITLVHKSK